MKRVINDIITWCLWRDKEL